MIQTLFQVALGGALGASARYMTNMGMMRLMGPGFPWATLTVNVFGSFVMGLLAAGFAHLGGQRFAPFLMTGVLGGFTTFSAFSLDATTLWTGGRPEMALLYVAASIILSLAALSLGLVLVRSLAA